MERPPRDTLVRAVFPGFALRAATDESTMPVMTGHFAVFNRWTEIDSIWEGRFMERIAPGAFKKTFSEQRDGMRVLFQHGRDPSVGSKPIGSIDKLREDDTGAYYEVPLLDAGYVRDLIPGLEKGLYGASFRFSVTREDMNNKPERSDHNPDGIPERTLRELAVREFGPVTFPAYADATAGVRSLTDEYILMQFADPERLRKLLDSFEAASAAPSEGRAEDTHPTDERRHDAQEEPPIDQTVGLAVFRNPNRQRRLIK